MSKRNSRILELGITIGVVIFVVGVLSRFLHIGSGRFLQIIGLGLAITSAFFNMKAAEKGKTKATLQFGLLVLIGVLTIFKMAFGYAFRWILFFVVIYIAITYGKRIFSSKK